MARSTCPSQNVQNTPCSDHFWKLRCRKSVRRFRVKHVPSQNVQDTPCLDHLRCDVEKVHAVVARSTFPSRVLAWICISTWINISDAGIPAVFRCAEYLPSQNVKKKHNMFGPLLDVQKSQNALVRGRQLCIQLYIHF